MVRRIANYISPRKEKQCWRCSRWMSEAGFKNQDARCLQRAIEADKRKRGLVMIGEFPASEIPF